MQTLKVKAIMKKFKSLGLAAALGLGITMAYAVGPNPNVKYFGYDWVDFPGETVQTAISAINSTGPASTNFNVVRTLAGLNSSACANFTCALGISAGDSQEFDICPAATSYNDCLSKNPWANLWSMAAIISGATNKPAALYFVDEPSQAAAFRNGGYYVPWSYASYVCTLREAMTANGINIPIFTILAMGELQADADDPNSITREFRNQMPVSGCPSGARTMPDAVGIDNYTWKHEVGVHNDTAVIHSLYQKYFPAGGNIPMWVLVPPGNIDIFELAGKTDDQIKDHVQVYWDLMAAYPNAPITGVMVFRFDRRIMTIKPNTTDYTQTRGLLKYMGNRIVD